MFCLYSSGIKPRASLTLSYIPRPRVCMHMGVHIGVHAHTCEQVSKESERILDHLELEL